MQVISKSIYRLFILILTVISLFCCSCLSNESGKSGEDTSASAAEQTDAGDGSVITKASEKHTDAVKTEETSEAANITEDAETEMTTAETRDDDRSSAEETAKESNGRYQTFNYLMRDYVLVPDLYGKGLVELDILDLMISDEPLDYSTAVALKESPIRMFPSVNYYDFAVVYKGRTVEICKKVRTIDIDYVKKDWYLIRTETNPDTGYYMTGFIEADDFADASKVTVEAGAPYVIKTGTTFYREPSCTVPQTADHDMHNLEIADYDENTGIYTLKAGSFKCYIKDLEDLDPDPAWGPGTVIHGN